MLFMLFYIRVPASIPRLLPRQASAEEVSAVYKDLPPEAQANLKEALAALHKAWNRWTRGWWPVGKWVFKPTRELKQSKPLVNSFCVFFLLPAHRDSDPKTLCVYHSKKIPTGECEWCEDAASQESSRPCLCYHFLVKFTILCPKSPCVVPGGIWMCRDVIFVQWFSEHLSCQAVVRIFANGKKHGVDGWPGFRGSLMAARGTLGKWFCLLRSLSLYWCMLYLFKGVCQHWCASMCQSMCRHFFCYRVCRHNVGTWQSMAAYGSLWQYMAAYGSLWQ